MRTAVEQIKEKLGIVEVVQNYVKLEHAGANMKGRCPFHNEKTPSFFVSPSRNSYYCFGCNAKGDIFTFVQEFEKVDFKGALKILADRAGVALSDYNPAESKEKDILFEIMEEATKAFEANLKKDAAVKAYLSDRGLTDDTISKWRIGFAPDGWHALHEHLRSKKFKDVDIEKAGLIKKGEKGFYDRFRGRILFPIFDPSERVIGFSGRIYESSSRVSAQKESTEPKYLNSPDTPLFNKSEVLYGYHVAKNSIRQKKFSLLVEGQMDLLMCQQAGLSQAVATSGTALTEEQLLILKRFSPNLMSAYDGDKAGISASKRAFTLALSLGFDVKVAPLPPGSDPADVIRKDPEEFKKILRGSMHIIDFTLRSVLQKGLEGRALLRDIRGNVLPYVNATVSPVERSYFVSSISEKIKVPESALYEELAILAEEALKSENLNRPRMSETSDERTKAAVVPTRKAAIERKVVGAFLVGDQNARSVMEKSFERLFEDMPSYLLASIVSSYDDDKEILIFEAEKDMEGDRDKMRGDKEEDHFGELASSLKREILKTELDIATSDLRQAEKDGDAERALELLKVCSELTKRLSYLKM